MTNRDWQAYASMDALRHAHDYLFDELPKLSSADHEKSCVQIDEFINRAISTGRILDTISDRREAQGLIDYWIASSYTKPRSRGVAKAEQQASSENQPTPVNKLAMPDAQIDGRSDNQLESFDQAVIDFAAGKGDEFVLNLSNSDRELTRRILFRMIHFPDTGDNCVSAPASLDELRKFGDPDRVDRLLAGLKAAGVVSVKSTEEEDKGEVASLHYLALTRRWKWLDEEIKKRMNFRDLALSWVGSGRSSGALLNWSLTRKFREYSNLSGWETDFVNKSGRFAVTRLVLAAAVVLSLIGMTGIVGAGYYYGVYLSGSNRFDVINQEIKTKATPVARKIEDINWLARFRLPINVIGVDFDGQEAKDLKRIFASSAVFTDTKLTAVQFDGAYLAGASFNFSVIDNTSFIGATLTRARFDGAEFCERVDFTDADLLHASLKRTRFSAEHVPILARTPWWLANGLGFDEIKLFGERYPRAASAREFTIYQLELERLDRRLDEQKDQLARAVDLNERAWTLATLGVIDDGIAEKSVRDALGLLDEMKDKGQTEDDRGKFDDTLAYILLQKSEEDSAKKAKNLEDAANLLAISAKSGDGEVLFRLAVASFALNRDWKASLENALIQQQYDPTHELYLLNQYITGELKQRVMDITGRPAKLPFKSRCPVKTKNDEKKAETKQDGIMSSTTGAAGGQGGGSRQR